MSSRILRLSQNLSFPTSLEYKKFYLLNLMPKPFDRDFEKRSNLFICEGYSFQYKIISIACLDICGSRFLTQNNDIWQIWDFILVVLIFHTSEVEAPVHFNQ